MCTHLTGQITQCHMNDFFPVMITNIGRRSHVGTSQLSQLVVAMYNTSSSTIEAALLFCISIGISFSIHNLRRGMNKGQNYFGALYSFITLCFLQDAEKYFALFQKYKMRLIVGWLFFVVDGWRARREEGARRFCRACFVTGPSTKNGRYMSQHISDINEKTQEQ